MQAKSLKALIAERGVSFDASTIMNAIWTGEPSVVYGNVRNDGLIDNLPQGCCVSPSAARNWKSTP